MWTHRSDVAKPGLDEYSSVKRTVDDLMGANDPSAIDESKPESTEGRPWGQPLKKPAGAPLNLG